MAAFEEPRRAQNANDSPSPGRLVTGAPPFSEDDECEGAYLLQWFQQLHEPIVSCCDICDPSLLDIVRPGPSTTKRLACCKHPNPKVISALREWCCKALINDDHPRYLPASYILSEEAINQLASRTTRRMQPPRARSTGSTGHSPPSDQMYLINHYLELGEGSLLFSNPIDASTTNSVTSIIANINECAPLGSGRNPNFVLMDYVDVGSPLTAVNQLNGLT